jgi:hypothetical protein
MACVFAGNGATIDYSIDKVYLTLADGTSDCELKSCPSYPGTTGSRGTVPSTTYSRTDSRFLVGGQIPGSCLSTTTTHTINPYVQCSLNAAGAPTWSSFDDSMCKFKCTAPAGSTHTNASGCGGGTGWDWGPYTVEDGQGLSVVLTDNCGWNCDLKNYGYSCHDGTLQTNYYQGGCTRYTYNGGSNSWSGGVWYWPPCANDDGACGELFWTNF